MHGGSLEIEYLNFETDVLTYDLDDFELDDVRDLIKKLAEKFEIKNVEVWKRGKKNWHLKIHLKKNIPIYYALLVRLVTGDDLYRVKFDTLRVLSGNVDHIDKLFVYKIEFKKFGPFVLKKVREYEKVRL